MIIEDSIVQIFTTYLKEVEIEQKDMGIAPAGSPEDLAGVLSVLAQILIVLSSNGPHSHLLGFLSSRRAWPIDSIFCRVNGLGHLKEMKNRS